MHRRKNPGYAYVIRPVGVQVHPGYAYDMEGQGTGAPTENLPSPRRLSLTHTMHCLNDAYNAINFNYKPDIL